MLYQGTDANDTRALVRAAIIKGAANSMNQWQQLFRISQRYEKIQLIKQAYDLLSTGNDDKYESFMLTMLSLFMAGTIALRQVTQKCGSYE